MNIATHNSWSYRRPVWWLIPFAWVGRCQRQDIRAQYAAGVRLFDLRVGLTASGRPYLCHGRMRYAGTPEDLELLAGCFVRVMFEDRRRYKPRRYAQFAQVCAELVAKYPAVRFFGANSRYQWTRTFYDFQEPGPTYTERHASVMPNAKWYEVVFPYLYARRCNLENLERPTPAEFLMVDFYNII